MTTITREEVKAFIEQIESDLAIGWEAQTFELKLARIAQASLDAEPVRYLNKFSGTCVTLEQQPNAADDVAVYMPLYAAPPVPDAISTRQAISKMEECEPCDSINVAYKYGWNACRAAMLQGSQPVSNHDELPYAQVKAVADLYALCWQSGGVVTYTPDPEKATIWLNNYSGTCVQEYVKLERLQDVLTGNSPVIPDEIEPDSNNTYDYVDGWNACRDAMLQANQRDLSQPVDPQVAEYEKIMLQAGWVMVPVEPTEEMIAAAMECEDVLFNSDESFCVQFREIYYAMVDAAPKPEVNSEPN
ncbi:hypothetical protein [Salmonella enterica]|uniref:hypothetical protein n=1 Tax=Salmonella enterica TaxID=28901 RepID=UPI001EFC8145|nr:hypothetical protein [Salmonella enterica]